jgi:ATP-dependent exoDNAse (exonuclease V) beta subunit
MTAPKHLERDGGSAGGGGRHALIEWSPAALELFHLDRTTAVSAGAGSGKTTCLVELCLRLLSGEAQGRACDPSEIVAVTFTREAGEELSDRLRAAVAEKAAAATGDEARAWVDRLAALDRMAVGTIHGFSERILREHAPEAGLDPQFSVLAEQAAASWRRQAARAAVVAAADAGRPETLQLCAGTGLDAPRFGLGEILVQLMMERATRGDRAPPQPVADGVEAAQAIRREILARAGDLAASRPATESGRRAVGEIGEILAGLSSGDRTGPLSLAAARRLAAMGRLVSRWRPGKQDPPALLSLRDALKEACDACLPRWAEVLAAPAKRELCALLADAEHRYRERKRLARALDFDDLLIGVRDLLRDNEPLRQDQRRCIRALLVDEYQDVNALQQEIFFQLCGDGNGGLTPGKLVAVGDLKQSIYGFRGADVSVFAGLIERLEREPGGRVLRLTQNHRSVPAIVEVVNAVSSGCMRPAPVGLGEAGSRDEGRPYELVFGESDRLLPTRPEAERPACDLLVATGGDTALERRAREARALANHLRGLVSAPGGPGYHQVAILFRRMTQLAPYEEALREAGIPYRLARGGGFFQAPEVRDLGEWVASLFDPGDATAWAALLRSPYCALSDGGLLALAEGGLARLGRPGVSTAELLAGVDLSAPEAERLDRFLEVWRRLRDHRDRIPLADLLEEAVERLDLEAVLLAGPDGARQVANVRKALFMAREWTRSGEGPRAFGDHLRAMARRPPVEPEADLDFGNAVSVLSVHQAKGLEWPVVYLADLGAEPPGNYRRAALDGGGRIAVSLWDPGSDTFVATAAMAALAVEGRRRERAESRRLLYVALTRARDRLVLSGEARLPETWRAFIESAVAERPELVRVVEGLQETIHESLRVEVESEPVVVAAGEPQLVARRPAAIRVAVTELAGLEGETGATLRQGQVDPAPASSTSGGRPRRTARRGWELAATARGTLAHAMLAELDLGSPPLERRAQLVASAMRRGYDPEGPVARRIIADLTGFAESAPGRRLARLARMRAGRSPSSGPALRREVPFLLKLPGGELPDCYLVGALDALCLGPEGMNVIDFKYAMPHPDAIERWRRQLLAYALAARRAAPGVPLRATIQFLRGNYASADVTPTEEELERFAAEVPPLAWRGHPGGRQTSGFPLA